MNDLHDADTGEVIERADVRRIVGTRGEFGTVAILRDGSIARLNVTVDRAAAALGVTARPVCGAGDKRRRAA